MHTINVPHWLLTKTVHDQNALEKTLITASSELQLTALYVNEKRNNSKNNTRQVVYCRHQNSNIVGIIIRIQKLTTCNGPAHMRIVSAPWLSICSFHLRNDYHYRCQHLRYRLKKLTGVLPLSIVKIRLPSLHAAAVQNCVARSATGCQCFHPKSTCDECYCSGLGSAALKQTSCSEILNWTNQLNCIILICYAPHSTLKRLDNED